MNFTKLTVGKRLGAGFGAVLLMLMGMTVLAIFQLGALHADINQIVDKDWVKAKLVICPKWWASSGWTGCSQFIWTSVVTLHF